jgi:hypothetical protein
MTGLFVFGLISGSDLIKAEATRLIFIEIDGLPRLLLDAVIEPDSALVDELPNPELFRSAYGDLMDSLGRDALTPNLVHYLKQDGCRFSRVFSKTLTLSTPAWALILTGQPSIVKANSYFNRSTGEVRFYLDALRETLGTLVAKGGRTAPVWELDLLGIPLLEDFFEPARVWTSIQILYRQVPAEQLSELGKEVVTGEEGFVREQLEGLAEGYNLRDRNDQAMVETAVRKILEKDAGGTEKFDYICLFFPSLDHQFHVDADYRRTVEYMVKLDTWLGEIMHAVEESDRQAETVVAVISDHGSDFSPVEMNRSFPISRWLRRKEFGGHTILSPYTERIATSLSRPIQGIDSQRVYESAASSFGPQVPFGEEGYFTAFTNHQGNSRFDAFLRNADLNELHLILLKIKEAVRDGLPLERIFPAYRSAFGRVNSWITPEIESMRLLSESFSVLADKIQRSDVRGVEDAAQRLRKEAELHLRMLRALNNLENLPTDESEWRRWAETGFELSQIIPKGYLGPANTLEQIQNYVVGWRGDPFADPRDSSPFELVDYPDLFDHFQLTNPNSFGDRFPIDFMSASVPLDSIDVAQIVPQPRQVIRIWAFKGRGQALLVEDNSGGIAYLPIAGLQMREGQYSIEHDSRARDPFLYGAAALHSVHSEAEWAQLTGDTPYSSLPVILADLFRENYLPALESPDRGRLYTMLAPAELDALKAALRYRFRQGNPDFRVWLSRGWNANPNLPTPTGSHGGFAPIVTNIAFSVWGGPSTGLKRGKTIDSDYYSGDIAPTLLNALGKLSREKPGPTGRIMPILDEGNEP